MASSRPQRTPTDSKSPSRVIWMPTSIGSGRGAMEWQASLLITSEA
jgi:hypothetical protein